MIKFSLKLLLCFTVALVSCSCGLLAPKDDAMPLWKTQIFSGALALLEMKPHIWNGYTLFLGEDAGRSTLFLLNQSTGQVRWQWNDFLQTKDEVAGEDEQYLFGNKFCFQTLVGVYLVDLNTGKTIQKTRIGQGGGNSVQGLGSTFFNSIRGSVICQGTMNDGVLQEVFSLPQEPDFRVSIRTPIPVIATNQDTMLVLDIGRVRLRDAGFFGSIALYNLTKRQFVYDSARTTTNGSGTMPKLFSQKIYQNQGTFIVCNDLWTGRELWRRDFGNSFLGYGFSISSGKIFATNNNHNLECLNAETGQLLWRKERIAYDTPAPFVMNGVVYVASGVLWAFDANTGEEIWRRTSQDDTGFRGRVNGADGKVYAYTRQNAYCYKAAR